MQQGLPADPDAYVPLGRTFHALSQATESADDHFNGYPYGDRMSWSDLLALRRVVLLSEAGSGKTAEIKHIANTLRAQGKPAFFLRLEHMASDLEDAFEIGTFAEFSAWLSSSLEGWLLLDSIDEAKLSNPQDFQLAVRKLGRVIAAAKDRVSIILTSRTFAWQPKSDLAFCQTHLAYTPQKVAAAPPGNQTTDTQTRNGATKEGKPEVHVVTLDDLSEAQVALMAGARGVNDTEAFVAEIERKDAWSFAARPQDLRELADFWLDKSRIGSRSEIISNSISRRLAELDPTRGELRPLAIDKAREGARLVAAAATMTQVQTIRVPDAAGGLPGLAIADVLPEWNEREQGTLLSRPIFDQEIYGTVRFHHRSVREYLVAEWFAELLQRNTSRRSIEHLFFREQYGIDIVVPALRPILPWLIIMDERILERVRLVAPEIVFEGGDPARLPLETRRQVLREVCEQMSDGNAGRSMRDFSAVQRFASADLEQEIRELLTRYRENADLTAFLMRMVWLGKIVGLREETLAVALRPDAERYERITAFRALDAVGTTVDRKQVRAGFLIESGPLNREWLSELTESAEATAEVVSWLAGCLDRAVPLPEHSHDQLAASIEKLIGKSPSELLPLFVDMFDRLLAKPPVVERRDCEISIAFEWVMEPAAAVLKRMIGERHPTTLFETSLALLRKLSVGHSYGRSHGDKNIPQLEPLVRQWPDLNRALFWYEVEQHRQRAEGERVIDYWPAIFRSFSRMGETDFDYVATQIVQRTTADNKLLALSQAFDLYHRAGRPPAWRKRLRAITKASTELTERLDQYFRPRKRSSEEKRWQAMSARWKKQDELRSQKEAENLAGWKTFLVDKIDDIQARQKSHPGVVGNPLQYLFQKTRDDRAHAGRWTEYNWHSLALQYGEKAATFYRDAAVDFWRQYTPKLRSEGWPRNSTANATIIGLAGLEIEAIETPGWPSDLTPDEVDLACRYASFELNGFPPWFSALFQAFPERVSAFLLSEVRHELQDVAETDTDLILSDLRWSGEWAWNALGPDFLTMLSVSEPAKLTHLDRMLAVLQGSDLPDEAIEVLAKAKCKAVSDPDHLARWFAVWTGVSPSEAITALRLALDAIATDAAKVQLVMIYVTKVWGGRFEEVSKVREAFKTPAHLKDLYLLVHEYVRVSEDYDRANGGVYSPELRDNAQEARNRLFEQLYRIPGKEPYIAILEIAAGHPNAASRPWMLHNAKEKAEQDGDMSAWSPQQVFDFGRKMERTPANHRDLAELALMRMLDFRDDVEEGDDSIANVLNEVESETVMRNYIGRELRNAASNRYTIPQEEELADAKRPDLRFQGTSFDGPVPVELKLADNWSGPQLLERLENQLCGDYLRDTRSNRGMFVLVNRSKVGWEIPGAENRVDFAGLILALREYWQVISPRFPKIDGIEVVGIDLRQRFR